MSCGAPYVVFMVPDFDRLHKPSTALAGYLSSERKPCEASNQIKNFFLQHFSEKVLHPSRKSIDFCVKRLENAAKGRTSLSTFRQNPAPQTADNSERDDTAHFYALWLAQPSWSPIILTKAGWITVKGSGTKQVPLTLRTLESYYRRGHIIGKRFSKLTNYLMIDIDINSSFHPDNGGFHAILVTMEHLGLCRYLIVCSSTSGGLHLYFPLPEPINSWQLAYTAHSALTANGVQIIGGQCELFPNKKSFNAEHNGHRLPLQNGSFLLDDDFSCISNDKADFLRHWQTAAAHQDEETLQLALSGKVVFAPPSTPVELPPVVTAPQVLRSPTARTTHVIPPIAWTRFGQSNEIMRELANYGDRYVGHKNSADLAAWIKAVAPQLPGYQRFASPKSKQDIEYGSWPKRWAESHFRSAWLHKVGGSDHNANVARDAKQRLFAALAHICVDVSIGITQLWKMVSEISAVCFDKGIGWKTFTKHKDEVLAYIKRTGDLGLSSSGSEDVNSFSLELAGAQNAELELPEKTPPQQLLTLRCVIAIYSNAFTSFTTPKNEAGQGGCTTAKTAANLPKEAADTQMVPKEPVSSPIETAKGQVEGSGTGREGLAQTGFSAGQQVRIAMPGGSLDGIETRVLAQTLNVLGQPVYQLDYQRQGQTITLPAECLQLLQDCKPLPGETAIKATAAQLLQVLGKACPFVGPGLWTLQRSEVPAKAWGQLCQLVGEM